jgi:N-succinyl-L-ornithine transcarbamylase
MRGFTGISSRLSHFSVDLAMKQFFSAHDITDLRSALDRALHIKAQPYEHGTFGKHKTLGLLFFNPSLRTRLSSQKAAQNLGMECLVINAGTESWKMEFREGAIMDTDTVEHIKEGAAVLGEYCDIIGVRSFAGLTNREHDEREEVLHSVQKYSGKPIISLESALRHPLQSFADCITIEEIRAERAIAKPKVVLTWAPHPKALPQAVPNSFAEWMNRAHAELGYDIVIAHPPGYELSEEFSGGATIVHNQQEALDSADVVYVKNWSSYQNYGAILPEYNPPYVQCPADWTLTRSKLTHTRNAKVLHCLPTRRNVEIADDVLDSTHSAVIQEAGNRVVAMQTVLVSMLNSMEHSV